MTTRDTGTLGLLDEIDEKKRLQWEWMGGAWLPPRCLA